MAKRKWPQNTNKTFKYLWYCIKRIRKFCGKKTKDITEEEKQKYKAFFEDETGTFIIEKLTLDITERCKLPEAIELRKN